MATLEKRVEDLEYIIAHLPDDLNARFAGVDVKLATIREAQTIHTQRLSTLDQKVTLMGHKVDAMDLRLTGLEQKVSGLDQKVSGLDQKVDALGIQLTEVLNRLPRV